LKGFFWMRLSCVFALALTVIGLGAGANSAAALNVPPKVHRTKSSSQHLTTTRHSKTTATRSSTSSRRRATTHRSSVTASATPRLSRTVLTHRRHRYFERFTASSFAKGDIFGGDITTGEDPLVRQAAIDALGDMNGTAVVIDPSNGRILAMVNQKLALSPGAEPCSTIKLSVALAALSEGLVTRDTPVQLAGFRMNMTDALAKSNNLYFEELGPLTLKNIARPVEAFLLRPDTNGTDSAISDPKISTGGPRLTVRPIVFRSNIMAFAALTVCRGCSLGGNILFRSHLIHGC